MIHDEASKASRSCFAQCTAARPQPETPSAGLEILTFSRRLKQTRQVESLTRERGPASLASRCLLSAALAWCHLHGAGSVSASDFPPVVDPEVRQATDQGPTRVLVELRVPPLPVSEDTLSGFDTTSSLGSAIAFAQREVLARLPTSHFSVLRQFETVPFLALEIDADALRTLENVGALVTRIVPDRPLAQAARP